MVKKIHIFCEITAYTLLKTKKRVKITGRFLLEGRRIGRNISPNSQLIFIGLQGIRLHSKKEKHSLETPVLLLQVSQEDCVRLRESVPHW
jgi:hypothetical protein